MGKRKTEEKQSVVVAPAREPARDSEGNVVEWDLTEVEVLMLKDIIARDESRGQLLQHVARMMERDKELATGFWSEVQARLGVPPRYCSRLTANTRMGKVWVRYMAPDLEAEALAAGDTEVKR